MGVVDCDEWEDDGLEPDGCKVIVTAVRDVDACSDLIVTVTQITPRTWEVTSLVSYLKEI